MKKENLKKKLVVNKITLANLDYLEQYVIKGGTGIPTPDPGTVRGRSCDDHTNCGEPTCEPTCGC